LSFFEEATIF